MFFVSAWIEPLHIVLRGRLNGSRPLAEMTPKPTTKGQEAPTHPDQQAALFCSCGRVFFTASGEISFIGFYPTSTLPCDSNRIMLIYKYKSKA